MSDETASYATLSKRELIEELTAADERIDELESGIASLADLLPDDESSEEDDD